MKTELRGGAATSIDLQVMWNRLLAVVEEQAQVLIRTAFSPIVRECGDISAGIFDLDGRMLAQAVTGTPGHVNTMAAAVGHMLEAFPLDVIRPGDIYATNDPWLATGHLNDVLLVGPVFRKGDLVALVSCTSHLYDLGGLGMGPDGSDVFDEGLMIPPVRLVEEGCVNELLLTMIKANSRAPVSNEGDLYALIACCDVGAERLVGMMDEFSLERLDGLADYIIATSRNGTVEAIRAIPNGVYENHMRVDGYESEIELHTALTVADDNIVADFGGSSPCSRYGINVPINYTTAYSVFGLRCIIGPTIPNNAGSLEPFRITAPEGTILSAPRPVPVAMRHTLGHFATDLVLGCLHQAIKGAVPAESASCMWDLPMRNAAVPLPGQEITPFAIELTHHGGTGARPTKDGLSVTAYPSGVWGSQVEITESVVPVRILRRELRPDTGGAGRFRGGLGQVIELESSENAPISLFAAVDRIKYPARGREGGHNGATGKITLASGKTLSGKGEQEIPAGDRLIFETPGGGGYGDPLDRDPARVVEDVRMGFVSREAAAEEYTTVIDADGRLDVAATQRLRAPNGRTVTMGFATTTRPRASVARLTPYALGEFGVSGVERLIQLGQNELPFAPAPSVLQALAEANEFLTRYPDPTHDQLRHALAGAHRLDPDRIVCGAGSTELMLLLVTAYLEPGDQVVCSRYGYRYFQTLAAIADADVRLAPERDLVADVDAMLEAVTPATKIVFLANPNNPTGSRIETQALWRFREELRDDVLLVLDAAYGEFVRDPGYDPGSGLADDGANVVMLRTFSKIYGLASLRIGWAYGPPAVVDTLRRMRPPNAVSTPALLAAGAAVADQTHADEVLERVVASREHFRSAVRELGLTPYPSDANFVLIRFPGDGAASAPAVYDALKARGMLVRRMDPYGLNDCLRATIGTEDDMREVTRALGEMLRSGDACMPTRGEGDG